jgi:16S rRNA (cytosine967-C5)-methyltransferase
LKNVSREDYLEKLVVIGKGAKNGPLSNSALYLSEPCQVQDLPGFIQGEVSVQDEASQLVPSLLNLASNLSILDACAAPGGKTAHILESEHSHIRLLAIDNSSRRLKLIRQNLERLRLQAEIRTADASKTKDWWDGTPFDRILLDAPCSATGIIRRHPDIKLLRKQSEIRKYSDQQLLLLRSLWDCLDSDGLLLYTTCSVLREENDNTVERFLNQQQDAKYQAITADWGVECSYGRQLLPEKEGSDGFYFALLKKG